MTLIRIIANISNIFITVVYEGFEKAFEKCVETPIPVDVCKSFAKTPEVSFKMRPAAHMQFKRKTTSLENIRRRITSGIPSSINSVIFPR